MTAWPATRKLLEDANEWPRWEAFERAHPGTTLARVGDMTQASVPDGGDEQTLTRPTLRELLDALEELFGASG